MTLGLHTIHGGLRFDTEMKIPDSELVGAEARLLSHTTVLMVQVKDYVRIRKAQLAKEAED